MVFLIAKSNRSDKIKAMDHLGKLFGSPARIKIMRLFMLNNETFFLPAEIIKRAKISKTLIRKELNLLLVSGFIKKKIKGYYLNESFPQLELWRVLLIGTEMMKREDIASKFKGVGKIKFLTVSGIFLGEPSSRVDLMIVGENIKKDKIESVLKSIEADIGRELSYTYFDTKEFLYRLDMFDKLIFDILENPHDRIIESREILELSTLPTKKF